RKERADRGPRIAMRRKAKGGGRHRQCLLTRAHRRQSLIHPDRCWKILAVPLAEQGLIVEEIDLRGAAVHEQEDDSLRPGRLVWALQYTGDRLCPHLRPT